MDLEEIPPRLRTEYIQECYICKMGVKVLAQASNFPEYETEIYVQCDCGNFLLFILPVN